MANDEEPVDSLGWRGELSYDSPEAVAVREDLQGSGIHLGAVDHTSDKNRVLASLFPISSYPTIKVFPPGSRSGSDAIDFPPGREERERGSIVAHARTLFKSLGGRLETVVPELVSPTGFDENCGRKKRCAIAFLPHIRDSGKCDREAARAAQSCLRAANDPRVCPRAHELCPISRARALRPAFAYAGKAGRDELLLKLVEIQKKNFRVNIVWTPAGAQKSWEALLQIEGAGYPAIVSLRRSGDEKLHLKYVGKFSQEDVAQFLSAKVRKSAHSQGWAQTVPTIAWDGSPAPAEKNHGREEL